MTSSLSAPPAPAPAGASSTQGSHQIEFRLQFIRAWSTLWRGKLLILACMAALLVPAILYLQQATPLYTAAATVLIESSDAKDTLLDHPTLKQAMNESVLETEADVMASQALARRVVEKLKLDEDPEFNAALRQPKPLAQFLAWLNPMSWLTAESHAPELSSETQANMAKARIVRAVLAREVISHRRRSFILEVQFTSENREKAALIVNTLADLYVLDRLEASFSDTRRVASWLGERLEKLRQDVAIAEGASEVYRAANGLRRHDEHAASVTEQQLSELNSKLVLARTELAQKQARLDQVRALTAGHGNVETSADVLQSQLIQKLREQEASLMRENTEAASVYGENHPKMVGLRADLEQLHRKIASEVGKVAASLSNEVDVAASGVRSLDRSLDGLRQQSNAAGGAELHLRELERQAETSRSLYETFLTRFKHDSEQERIQRANARVLSIADVPSAPSIPNKPRLLMIMTGLGLVLGGALVFLLDRLDNAVRSADEAHDLTGLPTLAMVPVLNWRQRGGGIPENDMLKRPRSALADSLRSLAISLKLDAEKRGAGKIILVTSSVPREGKSFMSCCLARMIAKSGETVLLIDGDFRRPRLHTILGVEAGGATGAGLTQILAGQAKFDEVLLRDEAGSLDFLPAGPPAADQAELIDATRLAGLLTTLSARYDRIVVDSPPVLAVADTRILVQLADQVVYVVRWNSTPREAVMNGIRMLREIGANTVGTVLSQVDSRKHLRYGYGDYGHYYGRYHDYYAE